MSTKEREDPSRPFDLRQWWAGRCTSEDRQRVVTDLAIRSVPKWGYRFTVMTTLSVVVAVMGMSADAPAVVIGAMLIAPLMQPVLAAAACVSMALFRRSVDQLLRVTLATLWSIIIAYVLSALFVSETDLPAEITSRTAPDLRDLVVALGAGAAGAYATVRKDVSSSLPGVAVAVALVPPLGAVGISLQAGEMTFARGALLLYMTNLAAIVFAGIVVFAGTGFVPPRRLVRTLPRSVAVAVVVGAAVVAIAVPLWRASADAIRQSDRLLQAQAIVGDWLGPIETAQVPSVSFSGDRLLIVVRSVTSPPDAVSVRDALHDAFGDDLGVSIEWDRIEPITTSTTLAPTTTALSDEERRRVDISSIVDEWLSDEVDQGRLDVLTVVDGLVRIDATGVGAPPSVASLTERLDEAFDGTYEVQLTWLERQSVGADEPDAPVEILRQQVVAAAEEWADTREVDVTDVTVDEENRTAVVEVTGVTVPDASELVRAVDAVLQSDGATTVLFVERLDITQ